MTGKGRGCAKEGGDDDRVEPHVDVIFWWWKLFGVGVQQSYEL